MRKVLLTMKENMHYETIKHLVDNNGNKHRAAIKLNCTVRTINRKIDSYKNNGKQAFAHGNRNHAPAHAFTEAFKQNIIDLYLNKYETTNFAHFRDLLERNEHINIPYPTLYKLLQSYGILSPKAQKATRRAYAKKQKQTLAHHECHALASPQPILPLEDAHPRQERAKYFGESIQMDASHHLWFGDKKAHLHLAIDNATSHIVAAYFDTQQTLHGYYTITKQMIESYGIPYQIVTDNRTVFNYNKKSGHTLEKNTLTQYGFACQTLGIDLKTTSVPQAKGRVERSFGTHQSRLVNELKLEHINSIEEANTFLQKYIAQHNKQFALPLHSIKSVFEPQSKNTLLDHILAVITKRVIDKGHCIKFKNKYYATYQNDLLITLRPGTKVMVIQTLNHEMYLSCSDTIYDLIEVPLHQQYSEAIDFVQPQKHKKSMQRKPSSHHPWKTVVFNDYLSQSEFYNSVEDFYYSEAHVF